ncbi:unnamed protein product [Timema podura]|uniref:Uncharacterized protein n=1 Tax=Timema podura TaxID=61482 RepID=A0ABN7NGZ2_TIMPD|nr:unnamed protein product [Timema podura]
MIPNFVKHIGTKATQRNVDLVSTFIDQTQCLVRQTIKIPFPRLILAPLLGATWFSMVVFPRAYAAELAMWQLSTVTFPYN